MKPVQRRSKERPKFIRADAPAKRRGEDRAKGPEDASDNQPKAGGHAESSTFCGSTIDLEA